jgi:dTDP-4-amino-4,6-dideoxygalactose transaminase
MTDLPAILGGQPIFDRLVPMVRPVLPDFSVMTEEVQEILRTGQITKGKYMRAFEVAVARHLEVGQAVAVSSCTIGMMLVHKGLELTGEVVIPSFTFMATASALVWAGLRPVFADVDRASNNLDPAAAAEAITPQTTALLAVHQFGNPADIAGLQAVAERYHLKLLFDAAHGFGARYRGVSVGRQADAQIFSLSPTKLLISGEGGIVATDDSRLAEFVRRGREYGNDGNYGSDFPGLNARMPEFNAILGLHSLDNLEAAAASRNETAALFREALGQLPGLGFQSVHPADRHSYREFSLTIDEEAFGLTRNQLAQALAAENVDNRKYYDPPLHRHKAYRQYYADQPLPNTTWLADHSLSIPMWTNMSSQVALGICEAFRRIHFQAARLRTRLPDLLQPA